MSEREQWRWKVCLEISFEHLQKKQWLFWREDFYTLICFSSTHQRLKTVYLTGHWMLLMTLFKNLQVNTVFTQTPYFSAVKNWPALKWSDLENDFWKENIVTVFQSQLCDGAHSIFSIFPLNHRHKCWLRYVLCEHICMPDFRFKAPSRAYSV